MKRKLPKVASILEGNAEWQAGHAEYVFISPQTASADILMVQIFKFYAFSLSLISCKVFPCPTDRGSVKWYCRLTAVEVSC